MDINEKIQYDPKCKIICSNVPLELLTKNAVKHHFGKFGHIVRIVFRNKKNGLVIEYAERASAKLAVKNGGEFDGQRFDIRLGRTTKHAKKDVDPDWSPGKEVEKELQAMHATGSNRKYLFRSEAMAIDPQPPPGAKSLKMKRDRPRFKAATSKLTKMPNYTRVWTPEQLELLNLLKQPVSTVEEKYRVLEARDKLIRLRTRKDTDISKAKATVGTCPDMCPEKERLMRETQHQVALYEQDLQGRGVMNPNLAVKQYSRSSADQEVPLPHELRPVEVLQLTMGYLGHKIMNLCDSEDVNMAEWYHFLWDRTRGIRKDITQQELCCQGSVALIEQCARFHIHCSARLVAEDPTVCDQKINTENLTKCLQTLKYMYHDLHLKNEVCSNEPEFRAYVILLNLNDGNFMSEVNHLKAEVQKSPEIKFAISVYSAIDKNNYVKFFKLVRDATYLNACILLRYFIQVRVKALTTLLRCYTLRAPVLFPLNDLQHLLAFETIEATIDFVKYYGLMLNGERTHVILDRNNFQIGDPYPLDRAISVVESKRLCSVGEMVFGGSLPSADFLKHVPENSFSPEGTFNLTPFLKNVIHDEKDVAQQEEAIEKPILEEGEIEDEGEEDEDDTEVKPPQFSFTLPDYGKSRMFDTASAQNSSDSQSFSQVSVDFEKKQMEIFERQQMEMLRKQEMERKLLQEKEELEMRRKQLELQAEQARLLEEEKRRLALKMRMDEERRIREKIIEEERKQQEEKLREEEQRKLIVENRKKEEEKELQRKLLEENKRKEKQRELIRKLEEEKEKQAEIQSIVTELLSEMLHKVEDEYKKDRLQKVSAKIRKRKLKEFFDKWKRKAKSFKRKRDTLDRNPLWVSSRTLAEEGRELYKSNHISNLQDIKRYKSGKPENITIPRGISIEALNIKKIYNVLTESIARNETCPSKEIFWKVIVSIPDFQELKMGLRRVEDVLQHYFQWNDEYKSCLTGRYGALEFNKLFYSISKKQGLRNFDDDSDGLIFIAGEINEILYKRIDKAIENYRQFTRLPIVIILLNGKNGQEELKNYLNTCKHVSNFCIRTSSFVPENLAHELEESLTFLALSIRETPNLRVELLESFYDLNLSSEFWKKVNSYSKWNSAYKNCLKSPNLVIKLQNEGVDRLKAIVLNRLYLEYRKFPEEFPQNEYPEVFPCGYRYIPKFWRENTYRKLLGTKIDSLKLPLYPYKWPEENHIELEQNIKDYATLITDKPIELFYKIMAIVLKNEDVKQVLWTDIVGLLSITRLEETEFGLRLTEFHAKSIFDRFFVVYHPQILNELISHAWFYTDNSHVKAHMENQGEQPWKEEIEALQLQVQQAEEEECELDIDLDATLSKLTNSFDEVSHDLIQKTKMELKQLEEFVEDFDESVEICKNINEKVQETLWRVLGK